MYKSQRAPRGALCLDRRGIVPSRSLDGSADFVGRTPLDFGLHNNVLKTV